MIEIYARFHAAWWGRADTWTDYFQQNACLTVSHEATSQETIATCERFFGHNCFPRNKSEWGDTMPSQWEPKILGAISLWAKRFAARCKYKSTLTLIHGDAHLGNAMVPLIPNQGSPLLVDWEGISIGIGAWDIARLLHHADLDEATLIRFESLSLEIYHRALSTEGVRNYHYQDLLRDYRLSLLAYVPHSLAWGDFKSMEVALQALERWDALNPGSV